MAHYPKKTIFSTSPGLESPRPEQKSIFSQSPSLPRPQSTFAAQILNSPLPDGISRISSSKMITNDNKFLPKVVTMNREALETLTESIKPRNRSPFNRVELLEKKNLLLEEENIKLMEINQNYLPNPLNDTKLKELELKIHNIQTENFNLIKELNTKRSELISIEKLFKAHQDEYNVLINNQNSEKNGFKDKYITLQLKLAEELEQKKNKELQYEESIRVQNERNNEQREENSHLLQKFREVTLKYDEQVQKNQDLDQYYSRTMLEYKAEIESIRSQYDTKIQSLTISKDKFNEYVNASRYEMEHLKRQLKEKNDELNKMNNIIEKTPLVTDSNNNMGNNEYLNHTKRYNIDDFGEKIATLLQENEKLNDKVAFHELEMSKCRSKCRGLEEKIKNTNNNSNSHAYMISESDVNDDEPTLKEKNTNTIKSAPKIAVSKQSLVNTESKRTSYKNKTKGNVINVTNSSLRQNISKENLENSFGMQQGKVLRNNSGNLGLKQTKFERNLSYSIKKNY